MPTINVPEETVVKGVGMVESCPVCKKEAIIGTRKIGSGEVAVATGLLLLAFPVGLFYAWSLHAKDYQFSCPCGYKWTTMPR